MIKDLILIGSIIIASFIFKITTSQSKHNHLFDPQMMFILLTLAIIIIHKIFYIKKFNKINKEGFQSGDNNHSDLANELLNFTSGQQNDNVGEKITTMSEAARKEYLAEIKRLSDQVKNMNQRLGQHLGTEFVDDSNTNNRLDLESMQQLQDSQIKILQEKVDMAKNLLNEQSILDDAKKYRPIKVYSSCSVSSADGTFNEDTFQNTNNNSNNNGNNNSNSNSNNNGNNSVEASNNNRYRASATQSNVLAAQVSSFLNSLRQNNGNVEIH